MPLRLIWPHLKQFTWFLLMLKRITSMYCTTIGKMQKFREIRIWKPFVSNWIEPINCFYFPLYRQWTESSIKARIVEINDLHQTPQPKNTTPETTNKNPDNNEENNKVCPLPGTGFAIKFLKESFITLFRLSGVLCAIGRLKSINIEVENTLNH